MKITHISDTHNKHNQIKWDFDISNADMIIHSGDLTNIGEKHEMEQFFGWYSSLPIKYKIVIAGNHDKSFDPKYWPKGYVLSNDHNKVNHKAHKWSKEIISEFNSSTGNYYLENTGCEIEGINFWGSPITPWFHGDYWAFNEHRGFKINEIWNKIPINTDVLITHGPPMGYGDYVYQTQIYAGCEQLREKIKEIKPLLHCFGHIHHGNRISYDNSTLYSNGSLCNDYNEIAFKPNIFELDKNSEEKLKLIYSHG